MERKKPHLMGISSPLTQPVEGWYTIQGQQNSQTLTDHTSSNTSSNFFFFYSLFFVMFHVQTWKKGHLWVSFIQHNPWSSFAVVIATLWFSSCGQRGQQRAGCRPEQCHYRLSLNQASIRIHCLQERCSGRGERGVHSKHPQAGTNRRNAPKAKMVNQRLKDNLGQISEHPCSGRKKTPL